jgi:hypothetical protein
MILKNYDLPITVNHEIVVSDQRSSHPTTDTVNMSSLEERQKV